MRYDNVFIDGQHQGYQDGYDNGYEKCKSKIQNEIQQSYEIGNENGDKTNSKLDMTNVRKQSMARQLLSIFFSPFVLTKAQ